MLSSGIDPYPVTLPADHRRWPCCGTSTGRCRRTPRPATTAGVAGRVILSRIGGKLCFATLRDGTGDIQVMISLAGVGEDALAAWKRDVDLGDHVGVTGEVITSRSGELSVLADSFAITAKSLRPLPDKHAGLTDPESRVRQRYVDLIVNPRARQLAEMRSAVIQSVRSELIGAGLHGGRDAGADRHSRRGERAAVRDALQRLRRAGLHADRARAVPEAARRRRDRVGLRDRAELQERGRRRHPQPRVHHARGVPGLRRLQHDGGADAGPRAGGGDRGVRLDRDQAGRRVRVRHRRRVAVDLGARRRSRWRSASRSRRTPRRRCSGSCARSWTCRCSPAGTGPRCCWRCTSGWWRRRRWSRRSTGTSRSRYRR